MQPRYIDSETTLFGNLADELSKISEEVFEAFSLLLCQFRPVWLRSV